MSGGEAKRKSPANKWFTEPDRYTIVSPTGNRNLDIENTLGELESEFARLREKLENGIPYSPREKMVICAFSAAMSSRSKAQGDHWAGFFKRIRQQAANLAAKHGHVLESEELDDAVRNPYGRFVEATLPELTPRLFRMYAGIYISTDSKKPFITSDNPCVWHDPTAYKRPPAQRYPALMYRNIQITLPISPKASLMFTYKPEYGGFRRASAECVDTLNHLTRFHTREWFVTRDGKTEKIWFEARSMPEDAWENTPEGKKALKQAAKYQELQEEWERSRAKASGKG